MLNVSHAPLVASGISISFTDGKSERTIWHDPSVEQLSTMMTSANGTVWSNNATRFSRKSSRRFHAEMTALTLLVATASDTAVETERVTESGSGFMPLSVVIAVLPPRSESDGSQPLTFLTFSPLASMI